MLVPGSHWLGTYNIFSGLSAGSSSHLGKTWCWPSYTICVCKQCKIMLLHDKSELSKWTIKVLQKQQSVNKICFFLPCLICGFPIDSKSRLSEIGLEAPEERAGTSRRTGTDLEKTTAEFEGTGTTRSTRGKLLAKWIKQNQPNDIEYIEYIKSYKSLSKRSEIEVLLALPRLPSSRHIFGLPLSTKVLTVSGVAFRLVAETTYKWLKRFKWLKWFKWFYKCII